MRGIRLNDSSVWVANSKGMFSKCMRSSSVVVSLDFQLHWVDGVLLLQKKTETPVDFTSEISDNIQIGRTSKNIHRHSVEG